MSTRKNYTINGVTINDEVLKALQNIYNIDKIRNTREKFAETIMGFSGLSPDERPDIDFCFLCNQLYLVLKAMEPLEDLQDLEDIKGESN